MRESYVINEAIPYLLWCSETNAVLRTDGSVSIMLNVVNNIMIYFNKYKVQYMHVHNTGLQVLVSLFGYKWLFQK